MEPVKYPRTPHLPFSGAVASDDVRTSLKHLDGELVVTEKLDGENTTFARDFFHARSLDSRHHPSRDWVKNLWSNIRFMIPEGRRLVVENLYAKHSIGYDDLESFAYGICVIDGDRVLPWDETVAVFEDFSIPTVPALARGSFTFNELEDIFVNLDWNVSEGVVVRTVDGFALDKFGANVAKAVRPGHVVTSDDWSRNWQPNQLKSSTGS